MASGASTMPRGSRRSRASPAASAGWACGRETGSRSSCRTAGRWRRSTGPASLRPSSRCRSTGAAPPMSWTTSSRIPARRRWPSTGRRRLPSQAPPAPHASAACPSATGPRARRRSTTCWRPRPMRRRARAKTTSRSCSTPPAPPGAARACRGRTVPSAPRRSPTSPRTATAQASAPWASCRSTTPWACARCSPWRRWAAPSFANIASRRKGRSA